jgi:DNA-binding transcriptional regulator YdaS (Cro superfamily)
METGIEKAIRAAGSQRKLWILLNEAGYPLYRSNIVYWVRVGRIPAERVLPIERVTGVPRYELRPDLYPPEEYREAG